MDLEKASRRPWWRTWRLLLLLLALVVVIIVVAVPLAVILPRKNNHFHAANVMLPLYIFPVNNTVWNPLFKALDANPKTNFTIVVNPNSGPGSDPVPVQQWFDGMVKLNKYDNVRTIGYVLTHYATRNLSDVLRDISTYAGWSDNSSSIAVDGIFFDEAPYVYTPEATKFMRTIDAFVKNQTGIMDKRTVIHNPGVIPDAAFNDTNLDITIVFEDNFAAWQNGRRAQVFDLPTDRTHHSVLINSIPKMASDKLSSFLDSINKAAEFIYVTSNSQNFYESFAPDWLEFVSALPARK